MQSNIKIIYSKYWDTELRRAVVRTNKNQSIRYTQQQLHNLFVYPVYSAGDIWKQKQSRIKIYEGFKQSNRNNRNELNNRNAKTLNTDTEKKVEKMF